MAKRTANVPSASRIQFDRLYRGKPRRITALNQTRRELSLGRQIRQFRELRGLSQAQLARALRTLAPAISRIEDADYDGHSLRILRKIAAYFDQELIVTFKPKRGGARGQNNSELSRLFCPRNCSSWGQNKRDSSELS